jgi:hypothetical protein
LGISTTESSVAATWPTSATLDQLFVLAKGGNGSSKATFKVRVNGTDTTLACSVSQTEGACSDTTHTATISTGQPFSIHVTETSGSYSVTFRVRAH